MSRDSVSSRFEAHLRQRNADRLWFASWYFAALMAVLIPVEEWVPALRPAGLLSVKLVCSLVFCGLALLCRSRRVTAWPPEVLPLLFGTSVTVTGLLFSFRLAPHFGANPVYSTMVFVACLAPIWSRRALLAMLVPVHALYLWSVWDGPFDTTYRMVMTMGGTAALPLGIVAAFLAFRGERQAFGDMAAIRTLLDERRDLVAMVAHDLQSPLAGIRALLRTMSGHSEPDSRKLTEIARTCGDMHDAVTRLVQAHRQDATEPADRIAVPVDGLLQDAKARASGVADAKDIAIAVNAETVWVDADPALLGAILDNLVANAIKFSPTGSVVRLSAVSHESEVRLSVIDNGPGIMPDDIPFLFRKFSRLRTQPTGGEPTSGLGLYIVRMLAERMGARAGFAPNPGGGSMFFIDLPRALDNGQPYGASTASSSMPYHK